MSETVMEYLARFKLDTTDLVKGITGAAISFDAITMAAKEAFAMMKQGYDMTVGAAMEYTDVMDDMKNITGESFENLQRLKGAATATDTSFGAVSSTLSIFSTRLGDTGASGDTLRAKLQNIGVQLYDNNGQYRSAAELMMEINAKTGAMTDTYQRNNLLADIYGKSWYGIAEMIGRADDAAKGFKNTEVISDADLRRADEYKDKLNAIGERLEKMQVNIGMQIIDDPRFQLLTGNVNPDSILGMLMGMKPSQPGLEGPGYAHTLKQAVDAVAPLIDTYGGLSDIELEYASAAADVQAAQEELNTAMGEGSQSAVDKASLSLARAKSAYQAIRKEMYETSQAASGMNSAIAESLVPGSTTEKYDAKGNENTYIGNGQYSTNPYANNTSGGDVGSFGGKANIDFASSLSSTNDIWNYANSNADSSSQSSSFLAQIRAVAASARSIQMPGGANWTNTNQSGDIMNQTRALWDQYQQQKEGSKGFTQINYIQGENAQQVANAIAEATSRAIARQVSE
jgi:hypothetical protein